MHAARVSRVAESRSWCALSKRPCQEAQPSRSDRPDGRCPQSGEDAFGGCWLSRAFENIRVKLKSSAFMLGLNVQDKPAQRSTRKVTHGCRDTEDTMPHVMLRSASPIMPGSPQFKLDQSFFFSASALASTFSRASAFASSLINLCGDTRTSARQRGWATLLTLNRHCNTLRTHLLHEAGRAGAGAARTTPQGRGARST